MTYTYWTWPVSRSSAVFTQTLFRWLWATVKTSPKVSRSGEGYRNFGFQPSPHTRSAEAPNKGATILYGPWAVNSNPFSTWATGPAESRRERKWKKTRTAIVVSKRTEVAIKAPFTFAAPLVDGCRMPSASA